MKIFSIIICFSFVFIGCSTVKVTEKYGLEMKIVENVRSKVLIKKFNAEDKTKSFLDFTSEFDNLITVKNGDSIVLNEKSKTLSMLGYTNSCIILNNKDVTIIIDNKQTIKLNKEKLPSYKFIYVGKNKNHYKIEYTNNAKSFL
ncbi:MULTISPECIES: hypothetical protein [unclassified Chryseobacterium]|uniref:hypothetical protein n=1 Tax=unclassified Chryseobacterium TaxID=2593645 RepID=UPI00100BEB41|nr:MULTISPECIES: hypothetical protein [unclassified Chryseobacterium]RXM50313.1 hypothetical protein BOQ64_19720 [Chryseobacterium sp. CH25]RXM62496.1 hypothetical protein BOQ60_20505 [Chryseobacterium sp. CH1]